jgi:small subunit ribosomal protein S14
VAKKSKITKNRQRGVAVAKYAPRRAELKAQVLDPVLGPHERMQAVRALSRLPRDASPVRLRNRDQIDGRPRGHLRKFGLSRVNMRALAHRGELPGITKSSW